MKVSQFALTGGLDLTTPKQMAQSGTLSDCLNFEVGTVAGYSKISGYAKTHGEQLSQSFNDVGGFKNFVFYTNDTITSPTFTLAEGTQIVVDQITGMSLFPPGPVYTEKMRGYVVHVLPTGQEYLGTLPTPPTFQTAIVVAIEPSPRRFSTSDTGPYYLQYTIDGVSSYIEDGEGYAEFGYVEHPYPDEDDGMASVPPSHPDHDISGIHVFRDRIYAFADYPAISVANEEDTDTLTVPLEGMVILNEDATYAAKIVNTKQTSGTWGLDGATGRFAIEGIFGVSDVATFEDGDLIYVGYGSLDEGWFSSPVGSCSVGSILGSDAIEPAFTYKGTTDDTLGGLWRTVPEGGWESVDLLREIKFRDGQAAMESLQGEGKKTLTVDATYDSITSAFSTVTVFEDELSNAGNISSEDGVYASTRTGLLTALNSRYARFIASGGSFESIPDNAVITGVSLRIKRRENEVVAGVGDEYFRDGRLHLSGVGGGSPVVPGWPATSAEDKADKISDWPATLTNRTYGGQNDLWGQSVITVEEIKSANFGIQMLIEMFVSDGEFNDIAQIDYIEATVHYINATNKVFIRNANAGVETEVEVIAVHKTAGAYDVGTAQGYLTVKCPPDADKVQLISDGDQIRTASGGGGVLYATAGGADYPVTLPQLSELEAENSLYECINANFYASAQFDAMYGVNGAGPAFSWDDRFFIRIHTEQAADQNKPRHVSKHAKFLLLGYKNGTVLNSVSGDPTNVKSADGAGVTEFGESVNGFLPMLDDVTGVFLNSKIKALRGYSTVSFSDQSIAPKSGALEYNICDVGRQVYYDNFGANFLTATDAFGSFANYPLSHKITPWLRQRIQSNKTSSVIRPVCTIAVRSKNQTRTYFSDGYVLTMTLWGAEQIPMFTKQMYGQYIQGFPQGQPAPVIRKVRQVISTIYSDGKERIIAIFKSPFHRGVYELDRGATFSGETIENYIELNWNDEKDRAALKTLDRVLVGGMVNGTAPLRLSTAFDYKTEYTSQGDRDFGRHDAIPLGSPIPMVENFHVNGQHYDVSLRFSSMGDGWQKQAPITLQTITMFYDLVGTSRGKEK